MKNRVRVIFLALHVFLATTLMPLQAYAGPGYPACFAVCLAQCLRVFATCGSPGDCTQAYIICNQRCAANCLAYCFANGTKLTVLTNGVATERDIQQVTEGDMVLTLNKGVSKWTKVVKNQRSSGEYQFLGVSVYNPQSNKMDELRITPDHGVILSNHIGELTIDSAKHLVKGDNMVSANGEIFTVTDISNLTLNEKYTLETTDGTVLASGLYVTTICSEEVEGGERHFDTTMKDWRARHNLTDAQ